MLCKQYILCPPVRLCMGMGIKQWECEWFSRCICHSRPKKTSYLMTSPIFMILRIWTHSEVSYLIMSRWRSAGTMTLDSSGWTTSSGAASCTSSAMRPCILCCERDGIQQYWTPSWKRTHLSPDTVNSFHHHHHHHHHLQIYSAPITFAAIGAVQKQKVIQTSTNINER